MPPPIGTIEQLSGDFSNTLYRYPSDLDPNGRWITFQLVDPSTGFGSLQTGSQTATPITAVTTHLPADALKTSYSVTYEDTELGSTIGLIGDVIVPEARDALKETGVAIGDALNGEFGDAATKTKNILQRIGNIGQHAFSAAEAELTDVLTNLPLIGPAARAYLRKAVNQRVQVLFKNVQLRKHDFTLPFVARNASEADTIQNILSIFKIGMLPEYQGSADIPDLFFGFPYEWEIRFSPTVERTTFRILRSVLTDMSINYAPNGNVFHADGQPILTSVNLSFLEMIFLTRDQFSEKIVGGQLGPNAGTNGNTYRF